MLDQETSRCFYLALTEQTENILLLISVTYILAFRVNQGPSDRMSLFPVLANLVAPWFLVFLKEPRYDTVREVPRRIRDEQLYERRLCSEGGVSVGPPWVSGGSVIAYGAETRT